MPTRLVSCAVLVLFPLIVLSGRRLPAQADVPLRYEWQASQVFAYDATIVVDLPDKAETYQGTITYTVQSIENDGAAVKRIGGGFRPTSWKSSTAIA